MAPSPHPSPHMPTLTAAIWTPATPTAAEAAYAARERHHMAHPGEPLPAWMAFALAEADATADDDELDLLPFAWVLPRAALGIAPYHTAGLARYAVLLAAARGVGCAHTHLVISRRPLPIDADGIDRRMDDALCTPAEHIGPPTWRLMVHCVGCGAEHTYDGTLSARYARDRAVEAFAADAEERARVAYDAVRPSHVPPGPTLAYGSSSAAHAVADVAHQHAATMLLSVLVALFRTATQYHAPIGPHAPLGGRW